MSKKKRESKRKSYDAYISTMSEEKQIYFFVSLVVVVVVVCFFSSSHLHCNIFAFR